MPTCNNCGREVEPEWNVCPDCGHDLSMTGSIGTAESSDTDPTGMTRRALAGSVAVAAAVGVAGLGASRLLGDTDHRRADTDAWVKRSVDSTSAGRVVQGTLSVDPGTYVAEKFSVTGGARMGTRIVTVDGGPFDVYGIRASEFDRYREGDAVEFVSPLSQSRIERPRGMFGNPPSDEYYLVIDHTAVYDAEPTGTLRVEVEMGVGDI